MDEAEPGTTKNEFDQMFDHLHDKVDNDSKYDVGRIDQALGAYHSSMYHVNHKTDTQELIYTFYLDDAPNEHVDVDTPGFSSTTFKTCSLELNVTKNQLEYSTGFKAGGHKVGKITSLVADIEGRKIVVNSQDPLFESILEIHSDGRATQITTPRTIIDLKNPV